jgi:hypothetical protein
MQDCEGVCVPSHRLGDGWCDAGAFNADLNCEQLGCDAGDCSTGCAKAPTECPSGQFRCDSGDCIAGSKLCDGLPDCLDKSDEKRCDGVFCCDDGSKCIPEGWRDDGWPDCLDASDEAQGLYNQFIYNINNQYCRSVLPMCDEYLQERKFSCSDTILPGEGCTPVPGEDENGLILPPQWNDGTCQPMCGTARCGYDGDDCPAGLDMIACDRRIEEAMCSQKATQAACGEDPQCRWSSTAGCTDYPDGFFFDDKCDLRFNTTECGYDNGECLLCTWNTPGKQCMSDVLGDGFCDLDCHVPECGWDEGDCPTVDETCPVSYDIGVTQLGDGVCDFSFNTDGCGCDAGDCNSGGDSPIVASLIFECANGETIFVEEVCDGNNDCSRGEDELGCASVQVCSSVYMLLETVEFGNEIQFSVDGLGPFETEGRFFDGIHGRADSRIKQTLVIMAILLDLRLGLTLSLCTTLVEMAGVKARACQ